MKKKLLIGALAVLAMLLPAKMKAQLLTTSKGTTLWGNVVYCQSWADDTELEMSQWPMGIYNFAPVAPSVTRKVCEDARFHANGGGFYRNGRFCFMNYNQTVLTATLTYYEADITNKEFTRMDNVEDFSMRATDLAYDHTTGNVYGQFYMSDLKGRCIGTADFTTLTHTEIARTERTYVSIAVDKQGKLYGISQEGDLYGIDKTTGVQTLIGATGVKPGEYRMSATCDLNTNTIYWACVNSDETSSLYTIDTATGKATKVMDFRDNEQILGLYVLPPAAEDGAPAEITDLACTFDKASTTGTVSFTAPDKTFRGEALTAPVTYVVGEGGAELLRGTAEPGSKVSQELTLTPGAHKLVAYAENEEGKGVDAEITVWAGYDNPVAPADVTVSTEETAGKTKVHLAWKAPEAGGHGGYVDVENMKYNVVRLPDNKAVATKISACSIDDEIDNGGGLQTYRYRIAPYNDSMEGAAATSDAVIVGSAAEIPYSVKLREETDLTLFGILDANGDGYTWYFDSGEKAVCYRFSAANTADDWLLTAPLNLQKDKTYRLAFKARCAKSWAPENIEAAVGQGNDPSAYVNILPNTEITSEALVTLGNTFQVAADGIYRIGLHAVSPANRFKLFVNDISVTDETPTGISAVDAAGKQNLVFHDLTGRRVSCPAKGVYIVNGKKIVR